MIQCGNVFIFESIEKYNQDSVLIMFDIYLNNGSIYDYYTYKLKFSSHEN